MKGKSAYRSGVQLQEAIEGYFRSISRTVTATERRETKDEDGKKLVEELPVLNDDGREIRYREYVIPPTVWGLCDYLDITRETWESYCNFEEYPQFHAATERAAALLQDWSQRALLTRKDVRGLIFILQNALDGAAGRSGEPQPEEELSLSRRRSILEELSEGGE